MTFWDSFQARLRLCRLSNTQCALLRTQDFHQKLVESNQRALGMADFCIFRAKRKGLGQKYFHCGFRIMTMVSPWPSETGENYNITWIIHTFISFWRTSSVRFPSLSSLQEGLEFLCTNNSHQDLHISFLIHKWQACSFTLHDFKEMKSGAGKTRYRDIWCCLLASSLQFSSYCMHVFVKNWWKSINRVTSV